MYLVLIEEERGEGTKEGEFCRGCLFHVHRLDSIHAIIVIVSIPLVVSHVAIEFPFPHLNRQAEQFLFFIIFEFES